MNYEVVINYESSDFTVCKIFRREPLRTVLDFVSNTVNNLIDIYSKFPVSITIIPR